MSEDKKPASKWLDAAKKLGTEKLDEAGKLAEQAKTALNEKAPKVKKAAIDAAGKTFYHVSKSVKKAAKDIEDAAKTEERKDGKKKGLFGRFKK